MRTRQEYYKPNEDYGGYKIRQGKEEDIFPSGSDIRIWYNDLPANFAPHWHNAIEIILPLENSYDVVMTNTLQRYHLLPGEFLLIPAGEMHEIIAPPDGCRFIFMFNSRLLTNISGYSSIRSLMGNCLYITPENYMLIYPELHDLLIRMANYYFDCDEFREFSIYSCLLQLYVTIAKFQLGKVSMFADSRPDKRNQYFRMFNQCLEYINQHYAENLSLESVADLCCLSKYHFSRCFKEYTGKTFYNYLTERRITAASELLEQADLSITEVAMQSGFSSISAFNRTFQLHKHCTPSEYRRYCDALPHLMRAQ